MTQNTHDFHIPLSQSLYRKLKQQADISQEPATEIVIKALEVWLREKEKEKIKKEIMEYALEHAKTSSDLDEELEDAAIEFLQSEI